MTTEDIHSLFAAELVKRNYSEVMQQPAYRVRDAWEFHYNSPPPTHEPFIPFTISQRNPNEFDVQWYIPLVPLCGNDPDLGKYRFRAHEDIRKDVADALTGVERRLARQTGQPVTINNCGPTRPQAGLR